MDATSTTLPPIDALPFTFDTKLGVPVAHLTLSSTPAWLPTEDGHTFEALQLNDVFPPEAVHYYLASATRPINHILLVTRA
jgi:hypothetical protein